jgi:hypothetical protein
VFEFFIFNIIYNISAANAEVFDILLFTLQMIIASIKGIALKTSKFSMSMFLKKTLKYYRLKKYIYIITKL